MEEPPRRNVDDLAESVLVELRSGVALRDREKVSLPPPDCCSPELADVPPHSYIN